MTANRLAVLGSPIQHSQSPALHAVAYAALGLDWNYSAVDVPQAGLGEFLEGCGSDWRGLSLTMPLKRDIVSRLSVRDPLVELTGSANTVLFTTAGLHGFNTDVYGVVRALAEKGIRFVTSVRLVGAGATAASVLVAVASLGATHVHIVSRSLERARAIHDLAETLGLIVRLTGFAPRDWLEAEPDLIVSTLPGGAEIDLELSDEVLQGATFFDVVYDPWPTPLGARFLAAGATVVGGRDMLLYQALGQVRIFAAGFADAELPNEAAVLAAMRAALS
ncbi:MAG: shikimate dehydrogenase [Microbacteriaceae bacterium]|nr:shikimate dehydrogenase [Microbacteriaceae bacterium]